MHPTQHFDRHGRCLPSGLQSPAHADSRRRFQYRQPAIDYPAIHARTLRHLSHGGAPLIPIEAFAARAQAAWDRLQADPAFGNISRGVGIPFLIPQDPVDDHGTTLETRYIPAVAESFKASLPDYAFTSHNSVRLAGNLAVAPGTRHEHLVTAVAAGDVVGWLFPCLLEYSLPAAREIMTALPEHFLLAGGIDTCAALVGSPDLLLRRDGYPPLLWLAALDGEKAGIGYHFEAYGYNLTFNRRPHLGHVAEYWSSALVVLA